MGNYAVISTILSLDVCTLFCSVGAYNYACSRHFLWTAFVTISLGHGIITVMHSTKLIHSHRPTLHVILVLQMSDKYTSKLYKIFEGDSLSAEEAKWNLMHIMHAVYVSAPEKDGKLRTTLLDLFGQFMDLKVQSIG
jgi:hypothetical protein